uniref:Toxin protein n=1 Tax=Hemiscorpius lepturus TaxID=520031 RepID=A0A1L4BJ55_HEMLE|nr:toxin protein [Hemiscorpius lepturus]
MGHLRIAVIFLCLSLCTLLALTGAAEESCQVGKMTIPFGSKQKDPGSCTLYECTSQFNRVLLKTLTCAKQAVRRGCKSVPGSLDAPFPDCCPTTLCRGKQWGV